jgi:nucleoid-associated protein YgaU
MGRLEKIVVLTVLFLVAVILGVSLTGGGEPEMGVGPVATLDPRPLAPLGEDPPAAQPAAPAGLLNASVQTEAPAQAPATPPSASPAAPVTAEPGPAQAATLGSGSTFLLTTAELEPSALEGLMIYTWKAGDSFASLAERLYGSRLHAGRLATANEGRPEASLAAGERILVPAQPAERTAAAARAAAGAPSGWTGTGEYVVRQGDVLSKISQEVYGTSKKWRRIFDANRDVLSDPNALRTGMRLRIPE